MMAKAAKARIESHGRDLFVILDGIKIAKRGHRSTPQAGQWVSIEPGFAVYDAPGLEIVIERNGRRLQ